MIALHPCKMEVRTTVDINTIKELIKNNNYIEENAMGRGFCLDKNIFEIYLSFLRFSSPMDFSIRSDIKEYYSEKELSLVDIDLIILDDKELMSGYFLTNFRISDDIIIKAISSKNGKVRIFGQSLITFNSKLNIVDSPDTELLSNYFINATIEDGDLHKYKDDIIPTLLKNILQKKSHYYCILNNLQKLICKKIIKKEMYNKFLGDYFIKYDYYNEVHYLLFAEAIKDNNELIDILINVRLPLDPFNKAVFFSEWLIAVRKYLFLKKLIEKSSVDKECEIVKQFIKKSEYLSKMIDMCFSIN